MRNCILKHTCLKGALMTDSFYSVERLWEGRSVVTNLLVLPATNFLFPGLLLSCFIFFLVISNPGAESTRSPKSYQMSGAALKFLVAVQGIQERTDNDLTIYMMLTFSPSCSLEF
jgi:hypothetical protein